MQTSAKTLAAALAAVALYGSQSGQAAILAPGALDGTVDANFVVDGVTLNGGQYIFDDTFVVPPVSGFYASSSDFAGYTNPISITFAAPLPADVVARVLIVNRSGASN